MGGTGMLVGAAAACSLLGVLSVGACSAPKARDLAINPRLYGEVGYRSKVPGDRAVFVAPLRDDRDASQLPASDGAFPITYDSEARWDRPVQEMVDDVLRRELEDSGIFAELLDMAKADALVLVPSLVRFHSATMERIEGGRTMAEVAIRVTVRGPEEGGGRSVYLDETFGDTQVSSVGMAPLPGYYLTGRALHTAIARMLQKLDGSNVSRSGVPIEPIRDR